MSMDRDVDEGHVEQGRFVGEAPREPFLRAPWPPLALAASFLILYGLQTLAGDPGLIAGRFGFAPAELAAGDWSGLLTSLFVHGGWSHAFLNGLGALAFGAGVARLFGSDSKGVGAFFLFFLICGVFSGLGYAAVHWGAGGVVIGASGGVSGLMGAASRLIERPGAISPFRSRTVIGMGLAWVAVNLAVGFSGMAAFSNGEPVAWEAHLAGYAVGLLLVEPVARLLGRIDSEAITKL